eukprot:7294487-Prymnesium_polylepis.1
MCKAWATRAAAAAQRSLDCVTHTCPLYALCLWRCSHTASVVALYTRHARAHTAYAQARTAFRPPSPVVRDAVRNFVSYDTSAGKSMRPGRWSSGPGLASPRCGYRGWHPPSGLCTLQVYHLGNAQMGTVGSRCLESVPSMWAAFTSHSSPIQRDSAT